MKKLKIFDTNKVNDLIPLSSATGHYINGMFDLHASGGTTILGYSHEGINKKIKDALDNYNVSFWKVEHNIWHILGEKLSKISNEKYSSFIPALTGSDAVDNAIKMMWYYHHASGQPKTTILIRRNSYHSGSITGWQMVNQPELSNGWHKINFVEFFDDIEETIKNVGVDNIAGVLIDTIPWVNGLHQKDKEYWENFQSVIKKYNLLLCVDEIITSLGRMGYWMHSHSLGLDPDIAVLGKSLAGGHSDLNVTMFNNKITISVNEQWLAIGNTRSINTLGAAAAVAVLDILEEQNILEYVKEEIIPFCKSVEDILTQKGIESYSAGAMVQAYTNIIPLEKHLMRHNLFHSWDYFKHLPFFNITKDEMNNILNTIERYNYEMV